MLKKIHNDTVKVKDVKLDEHIKSFIDSVGGIENVIGCSRENVYNEYELFCSRNNITAPQSRVFTRHLNEIYGTAVKLISYQSTPTYIICYYQEEN